MDAQSKETKLTEEEEAKPVVLHGLSRRSQFLIVLVVGVEQMTTTPPRAGPSGVAW